MEYLTEEIPSAIEQSLEGLGRVTKIVKAMKEFSHPDKEDKTPTDINKAVESTVTVARNEWKYVSEVEMDLNPDLPLVTCRPGEINQVVLNILVNAAHAIGEKLGSDSTEKGLITVKTLADEGWAHIDISDTGGGIPDEIKRRVFDPFFTTKAVGKGTGQGLSIAHSVIVNKHGGRLDFESEMGKGTKFRISLPIDESHADNISENTQTSTEKGEGLEVTI